jgi:hypothetical protein
LPETGDLHVGGLSQAEGALPVLALGTGVLPANDIPRSSGAVSVDLENGNTGRVFVHDQHASMTIRNGCCPVPTAAPFETRFPVLGSTCKADTAATKLPGALVCCACC